MISVSSVLSSEVRFPGNSKCQYSNVLCRCGSHKSESSSFREAALEGHYNLDNHTVHTQEVTSSRARFPKPVEQYVALSFFGHNIIVSEGEEWKKIEKYQHLLFPM
jgi:hypothetical protein